MGGDVKRVNVWTFSFDDGYRSWCEAAGILKEYGYRGTFNVALRNVVHKRVQTRPRMFPMHNVITWSELNQMRKDGHEIACHGTRHVDLPLCNKMELWMEVVASKKVFVSRGFGVSTYTCAFNAYNRDVRELSEKHYLSVRGGVGTNQLPLEGRVYHAMDGTKALKYLSELRIADNEWVVGIWHDILPEKFRTVVDKVERIAVEVKTVKEVYEDYEL